MPAYWRWKVTETWSLAIEDLPAESMATHMVAFLKEKYKGVFESSKRDREQLSEWCTTMWRSHNVQSGQKYRDRSKKLKEKVEVPTTVSVWQKREFQNFFIASMN